MSIPKFERQMRCDRVHALKSRLREGHRHMDWVETTYKTQTGQIQLRGIRRDGTVVDHVLNERSTDDREKLIYLYITHLQSQIDNN